MAKNKSEIKIHSYGIYKNWDSQTKELPQIIEFTTTVNASLDVEFGFIINVKKAKGLRLEYCIYHPNIPDEEGGVLPPFSGHVYIKSNNWDFYLGDTIWLPIETKLGAWRMSVEINQKVVAEKTFHVVQREQQSEIEFWQKRGYSQKINAK
ncbi:DUF3859 domain-containing protein [Pseudoalteromonas sp. MMG010]|uniref:DUF3859 domain-containing protein n=1 Tax=Pseudoalteromonas sp. MMG010 TaxID=2822685 RepID=UPI001B3A3A3E|nr:DUF3859 domain-containing protein [Pseudoalteromonas sp. MMG010]MBQ4832441.1 DUF3859 domain-containing protein [Pseudoalteromonas sp. MMG010]